MKTTLTARIILILAAMLLILLIVCSFLVPFGYGQVQGEFWNTTLGGLKVSARK